MSKREGKSQHIRGRIPPSHFLSLSVHQTSKQNFSAKLQEISTPTTISQVKMKFLATILLFVSIASAVAIPLKRSNQVNQINQVDKINQDVPYFCDAHPDAYPCSIACKLSGALQEYCHPEFCDNPANAKHWSCGPKYVNDHTNVLTEQQKYEKDMEWLAEHMPPEYDGGHEPPPKKDNGTTNATTNGATTVVV
jgi:hypothetical protein